MQISHSILFLSYLFQSFAPIMHRSILTLCTCNVPVNFTFHLISILFNFTFPLIYLFVILQFPHCYLTVISLFHVLPKVRFSQVFAFGNSLFFLQCPKCSLFGTFTMLLWCYLEFISNLSRIKLLFKRLSFVKFSCQKCEVL